MALFPRRWRYKIKLSTFSRCVIGVVFIYVYCEYLIYYVTQIQCSWPELANEPIEEPVYAMVLADTHLLGSRKGHWLDKWRREWQMQRAFQAAITLHRPEVVFVLGDLFDEGNWCGSKEFKDYVERFKRMFAVPADTKMHLVVGNHDIGFHYEITPTLASRFERMLDSPPVRLLSIRGNQFVLINSMAMEGDGCRLCARAQRLVDKIADILKCSNNSPLCKGSEKLDNYSRPIIMQHYPLYRESDSICTESDAAPLPERNNLFEERKDCLSKESTEYLVENLIPRAAFGGHTHHSCRVLHSFKPTTEHQIEFVEYSVPSFSWRNRLDPKYYLVTISPLEVKMSKCGLPREWTLQATAIVMLAALAVYLRYASTSAQHRFKILSGKKV
ncbi:hypothetical protein O0L34_g1422 [Tuta absoluta]|nr:hypothetical protein O0L34_g1422 [Tuta absoluta]